MNDNEFDINELLGIGSQPEATPDSSGEAEITLDNLDEFMKDLGGSEPVAPGLESGAESGSGTPGNESVPDAGDSLGVDIEALLQQMGSEADETGLSSLGAFSGGEGAGAPADFDEQINRMLDSDHETDELYGLSSDAGMTELPEKSAPASAPAPKRRMRKFLRRTAGVLTAAVLIMGVLFIVAWQFHLRLENRRIPVYTPVVLPSGATNAQLFTALSLSSYIGESYFYLQQMTLSARASMFAFRTAFDPEAYTVLLFDQDGNLFPRIRADIDPEPSANVGTLLRFAPVLFTTERLTLVIQQPGTAHTATFRFVFDEPPRFVRPLYMEDALPLLSVGDDALVTLDNARFSNSGTEIIYRRPLQAGPSALNEGAFTLWNGASATVPYRAAPQEFYFPEFDLVLGRALFPPLNDLMRTPRIGFRHLDFDYAVPEFEADFAALYWNECRDSEQRIPLGNHTLVLERIGFQANVAVLVLNVADANGARAYADVTAYLHVDTVDGPMVLTGVSHVSSVGTDIVFHLGENWRALREAGVVFRRLEIANVNVRAREVAVSLPMQAVPRVPSPRRELLENFIKNAFHSRLAYQTQFHGADSIHGFAPEVLENAALMRHFTPLNLPYGGKSMTGVRILAGTFYDHDTFLAVVEESVALYYDGIYTVLSRTHQVVVRAVAAFWDGYCDEDCGPIYNEENEFVPCVLHPFTARFMITDNHILGS